jgi:hypothetical protein
MADAPRGILFGLKVPEKKPAEGELEFVRAMLQAYKSNPAFFQWHHPDFWDWNVPFNPTWH